MDASEPGRTVTLAIPAKPDYVVLARLALSAVCRLSPLAPEEVADLKLAITEAATFLMGGERRQAAREEEVDDARLLFRFDLGDDELTLDVSGDEKPTVSAEERELSLALITATVDSYEYSDGQMRLTKQLDYAAE
jgi:anti-sigma regulatory factor (Ser/Thr protein kinase)